VHERTKNEIRLLVDETRSGIFLPSKRRLNERELSYGMRRMSERYRALHRQSPRALTILVLLLTLPLWGAAMIIGYRVGGPRGAELALLWVFGVLLVAALFWCVVFAVRQSNARSRGARVCLWCGQRLVGTAKRGVCSTCGAGYVLHVNEELYKLTFLPHGLTDEELSRRALRLWARAVRERETQEAKR